MDRHQRVKVLDVINLRSIHSPSILEFVRFDIENESGDGPEPCPRRRTSDSSRRDIRWSSAAAAARAGALSADGPSVYALLHAVAA
ncbi:hypothetical protein EVAR_45826_1 [Eumeta japonica]|uniref:Uncharacterized protein n=1 Tax=Eumeta variegata TaxID=151549 RepID=A0A4C1WPE4_EUMVA|nr:hypothetical protein EVAR_45826_1 [Eumeta japonica]